MVLDTNILIDLHHGNLFEVFFALPFRFYCPDVILTELKTTDHDRLLTLGLEKKEFSGPQVQSVMQLRSMHTAISTNDLFAFVLARDLNITLLTGDGSLRKLAGRENVSVHGILWVLDELVARQLIDSTTARHALCAMLANNARLPKTECDRRLRKWKT